MARITIWGFLKFINLNTEIQVHPCFIYAFYIRHIPGKLSVYLKWRKDVADCIFQRKPHRSISTPSALLTRGQWMTSGHQEAGLFSSPLILGGHLQLPWLIEGGRSDTIWLLYHLSVHVSPSPSGFMPPHALAVLSY